MAHLSLFFLLFLWTTTPAEEQTDLSAIRNELKAELAAKYPPDRPGAVVLIQVKGNLLLHEAYGWANLEWDLAMRRNGVFRLASVTKPLTAAAVFMEVEKGSIDLDADIQTYLPHYPRKKHPVTVRHLLQHTSGIPNFTDLKSWEETIRNDLNADQLTAYFRDKPLSFQPGTIFRYSNSGYYLLGMILEAVTGQTYAEIIKQRFATPLQLTTLQHDPGQRLIPNRVPGYRLTESFGPVHCEATSMTQPFAAGALLSSASDLATWVNALVGGQFIKPETLQRLWTPQPLNHGQSNHGMGWLLGDIDGRKMVWHNGGIDGFTTDLSYLPNEQILIITLHNIENPERSQSPTAVNRALLQKLLGAL